MKGLKRMQFTGGVVVATLLFFVSSAVTAQVPVDEHGNPIGNYDVRIGEPEHAEAASLLDAAELEELIGPVALYPDDLLAIVLPASTYPLEIVQAARFLEQLETDSTLEPDESWDDSVVALLNYPDVVRMMDEEIDWTWRLGEAVLGQQNDVIAAVERFRDRAYAAGNLKSDDYQKVSYDDEGVLEIVPVNEEIIYVPYYEPAEVLVYQPRRVYYYYPDPYPVYYYPYPVGYRFRSGYFWGVTTAFSIGWSNHYLHVYHPSYWGHPYYGRYYYGHYYRRPSITIYNNWYVNNSYRTSRYRYRDGDYWRPRHRAGSRPVETRVRNYHNPPDGSRSSRDYTSSSRTRVHVRDDGRMDLRLRERDRRTTTVNNQGNRGSRSITGSGPSDTSRTTTTRRNETRVSRRDSAADTRSANRRSITANSRREVTAGSRTTDRVATGNRTADRSNSATRNIAAASTNRATTRRSTVDRAATAHSTPPRVRQEAPSRRTVTAPRSAAPPTRSAPAPRRAAPAVQPRTPSAPRGNSRSTSRSQGSAAGDRRSSSSRPRARQNRRD